MRLLKWMRLKYNCFRSSEFRAVIELDPRYLIPSTWDDPLNLKTEAPILINYARVTGIK